jgi:hypothetical protein
MITVLQLDTLPCCWQKTLGPCDRATSWVPSHCQCPLLTDSNAAWYEMWLELHPHLPWLRDLLLNLADVSDSPSSQPPCYQRYCNKMLQSPTFHKITEINCASTYIMELYIHLPKNWRKLCIMESSVTCTLHLELLMWLKEDGWKGWNT